MIFWTSRATPRLSASARAPMWPRRNPRIRHYWVSTGHASTWPGFLMKPWAHWRALARKPTPSGPWLTTWWRAATEPFTRPKHHHFVTTGPGCMKPGRLFPYNASHRTHIPIKTRADAGHIHFQGNPVAAAQYAVARPDRRAIPAA